MPSHLRLQSSFDPVEANAIYQTSPTSPPAKKQKMSLTSTYFVASTARSKLGREAGRPDHNLRLLVGHANLLDHLMESLQTAEREQEAWFNQSVKKASKPEEPKHIQWIDTIAEEEEDDSDSESDDGSDIYDEDAEFFEQTMSTPLRNFKSAPVTISSAELEEDEDEDEDAEYDEDDDEAHALMRVASQHSPPELLHDSDSDSEDDMPPSPEQPMLEFNEKDQQIMSTTTAFYGAKPQSTLEDYTMQAPMIQAC